MTHICSTGGDELTAFLGMVDIEVKIIHISHVITTYTLESLSSLTSLKIGIVIFGKCFPSARPKELLREKWWLIDVGHNSWWHMKHAQYAAHNPKYEKMGLFRHPWWWYWENKEPGHMIEGYRKLRKRPQPIPTCILEVFLWCKSLDTCKICMVIDDQTGQQCPSVQQTSPFNRL